MDFFFINQKEKEVFKLSVNSYEPIFSPFELFLRLVACESGVIAKTA